jgi:hypothetical protein
MKIISPEVALDILNTWKMEDATVQAQFAVLQVGHCFIDGKVDSVAPHLLHIKGETGTCSLELPAFLEITRHDAADLAVDPSSPGNVAMCALEFFVSGIRCFIYKISPVGVGSKGIN